MPAYCPKCGAENRDTAKFCQQCAASMKAELICAACGSANSPTAKFCSECAAPLRGSTPPAGLTGLLPANATLSGRYLIVKRLGKGGMGAVYQATDTRIGGKVWAIKEMSDAALLDPADKQQARDAFQREAQMLALLDHVNLPKVNDFFTEGGKLYLVMDFIDGQTLQALLEARPDPFPEAQALEWAGQLCEVLDYLHRCTPPIIFRDLKPGNIMLDKSQRVKLIDFGVARLFKTGQTRDTANFGTAGYAPPEQYGKGQTDARSDIYALGVTLHELLTRYDPALTPFNLPPARNVNPAVSPHVEQAILRATQAAQINRFQQTLEFRAALMQASPVAAVPKPVNPPPVAPRLQPPVSQAPVAVPTVIQSVPNVIEPEMIVIPAGEFWMGSDRRQDKYAEDNEMPQHRVYLDEYWIGKHPVTQKQYAAFVQATGRPVPYIDAKWAQPYYWDRQTKLPPQGKENHPVVLVDWNDAVAYCQWLSQVTGKAYRLPTEAEWEKAARGPATRPDDGHIYPWGSAAPNQNRANFNRNFTGTTEVSKFSAGVSPYGAFDMAGNVWEWAADWYSENYYAHSPERNPQNTTKSGVHVVRGGSWVNLAINVRASNRFRNYPDARDDISGFRCACGATS